MRWRAALPSCWKEQVTECKVTSVLQLIPATDVTLQGRRYCLFLVFHVPSLHMPSRVRKDGTSSVEKYGDREIRRRVGEKSSKSPALRPALPVETSSVLFDRSIVLRGEAVFLCSRSQRCDGCLGLTELVILVEFSRALHDKTFVPRHLVASRNQVRARGAIERSEGNNFILRARLETRIL